MGSFQETIEPVVEIQHIDDSNSTCILCEYVMNILSNYVHRQSTEEEIEQSLQKVCNQIPSILKNQCHDYIDNYGPAIIATLLREFELSTICHKLNLCTNQMKIDITHIIKANIATCGICDYISTYLHFALKRDSNEKSLQHALSTVCSHLSNEQYPKCQTIVQLFSPHIRRLELSPGNNFCKQLTICQTPMIELKPAILLNKKDEDIITNSLKQSGIDQTLIKSVEKPPSIGENLSITPQCTLCHYIISYLDAVLKNNKSEQAFEEALEKVCTILPSKFN
jgi:saposin